MKIVVLDGVLVGAGGRSWEPIAQYGEFVCYDSVTGADDVAAYIGDADVVFTNRAPVDAATIARCPNLKLISSFGTGYNQIDLEAARARGIAVCNTPAYGRGAVAQMALALLLCVARNIPRFDAYLKQNGWTDPAEQGIMDIEQMELTGKTLGIIGLGDIGYAVARAAIAMDMEVLAYRRTPDPALAGEHLRYVTLDELVRRSDIISVHCPLNDSTRGMVDREMIAKMKDGVILINTSRGAVLNEADVAAALDSGKIRAAGVDVFASEPCGRDNVLANHPRCIATPHVAWMPAETRDGVIAINAENLRCFLAGERHNRIV